MLQCPLVQLDILKLANTLDILILATTSPVSSQLNH